MCLMYKDARNFLLQVWVNNDCSKGFYCDSAIANGGTELECGAGEMINIDIRLELI